MATTYTLIDSYEATGTVASIDFTSIPADYTDLVLKVSARSSQAQLEVGLDLTLNSSTASFTGRYLSGNGASASSGTTTRNIGSVNAATSTANTFCNIELYIPNYAGSTNKSYSVNSVDENNASTASASFTAGLWSNTAAINALTIAFNAGNFVQYSTATLYGISNS